jgi:hypothetical protein
MGVAGTAASSSHPASLRCAGRERKFLGDFAFSALCETSGAITEGHVIEFVRTYSGRMDGVEPSGLYQSMLKAGDEIKALSDQPGLKVPVLAVGAGEGAFVRDHV